MKASGKASAQSASIGKTDLTNFFYYEKKENPSASDNSKAEGAGADGAYFDYSAVGSTI